MSESEHVAIQRDEVRAETRHAVAAYDERRRRAEQRAANHPDSYFRDYGDGSWTLFSDDRYVLDWGNGPDEHPADDAFREVHTVVPRCRHGRILLGCDDDTCPEQTAYLDGQRAAMTAYEDRLRANARAALGLPRDLGGAR